MRFIIISIGHLSRETDRALAQFVENVLVIYQTSGRQRPANLRNGLLSLSLRFL